MFCTVMALAAWSNCQLWKTGEYTEAWQIDIWMQMTYNFTRYCLPVSF